MLYEVITFSILFDSMLTSTDFFDSVLQEINVRIIKMILYFIITNKGFRGAGYVQR